ncbi:hypothetical protein ACQZV8_15205 [Magnetococcales bacterium HHB-1]
MELHVDVPDDLSKAIKDLPQTEINQIVTEALRGAVATHQRDRQQAQKTKKRVKLSETPLFGMWADHSEIEDVDAYVRKIRLNLSPLISNKGDRTY